MRTGLHTKQKLELCNAFIKKNRAERKGGDDMQDYKEIAKKMQDEAIVKAGCGKYVIYRKDWLYEHIEQEYVLIKSAKEMKPIKDGITRLREYLKEQESKKNMKVFAEFDTYEEAAEYAQANLDGRYDIQPALHIKKQIWKFAILVPDEADID